MCPWTRHLWFLPICLKLVHLVDELEDLCPQDNQLHRSFLNLLKLLWLPKNVEKRKSLYWWLVKQELFWIKILYLFNTCLAVYNLQIGVKIRKRFFSSSQSPVEVSTIPSKRIISNVRRNPARTSVSILNQYNGNHTI